jgi:ubiquinone/menaquinone biosynthesis C-methylase UbiE
MPHVFDPHNFKRLDNPERRKLLPASKILREYGLRPGQTFVDIGAGLGFFALPAKSIVGRHGVVVCVEHSREMLKMLGTRAAQKRKSVELLEGSATATGLPNHIADMVLVTFVLHEVENRSAVLHEVSRVLKPGGRLLLIEWKKNRPEKGPSVADRIAMHETVHLLRIAGFRHVVARGYNPYHYIVRGDIAG